MELFRKGDFIRLKNFDKYEINRLIDIDVNVFEIIEFNKEYVTVLGCSNKIPRTDIEPILINGVDDLKIYYDPVISASIVRSNDTRHQTSKNYNYYFETFKKCNYKGKNLHETCLELGFRHVHEVQHFFTDLLKEKIKSLKINAK